ncbi:hypothetical protein BGY98DRAFT_976830 [Russula aff. rugulosa BPL654]|nr:hypothetical protein BGY98DRAFT_976830 [Russula aff. rugulosa BPL654]
MRSNEYESSAMSHEPHNASKPPPPPFGMSKTPPKKQAEQGQVMLTTSQIIKYVMFLNVLNPNSLLPCSTHSTYAQPQ